MVVLLNNGSDVKLKQTQERKYLFLRLKIASFLLPRSCDFHFASRVTLKGMAEISLE